MIRNVPVGCSSAHRRLIEQLSKVALTDAEILISGPSGTGKELLARFVHEKSRRSKKEFVAVNCGSLGNELLENVLFGHVGGAFTGAKPSTSGLIQAAEGGTLLLDEVDSLAIPCQIKLLRFLQDREYRRLGETRIRKADVRIISATNVDLVEAINQGSFRADLYFRLHVVPVSIPPLYQRPDDIELLIDRLSEEAAEHYGLPRIELSDAARNKMLRYSWPGNVRELQNCLRYLTCLQLNRPARPDDLPLLNRFLNGQSVTIPGDGRDEPPDQKIHHPLRDMKRDLVNDFERRYIEAALVQSGGNISQAAQLSGKARRAFFELMRKHDIRPEPYRLAMK